MSFPDRRAFLKQAALVGGIAALEGGRVLGQDTAAPARTARFKFSLAAYSYRSLLQGDAPKLSLFDFIDDCASFGVEGTELTSYYFPKQLDAAFLNSLKRHAFRQGLSISGTAVGNDFGWGEDDPRRAEQIEHVKLWVRHAQAMGAPVIRVFAGHRKPGHSAEESHALMVSALKECCEYAGQHGVHLALENHGGPTATVEGLLGFVRDVDSPWFGVNLDTGNFHSEDLYGELERAAPHSINVQVKVMVSGPDKQKKPADFARVGRILREAGYRGFVVLEYEESTDPRGESRRYLDELRDALA